ILKRSAADPKLFEREGRAVVFTNLDDLSARIDDPNLDVTADDFLVLQNAGPKSGYAMPEAGYLPIPAKLARAGVKDMVRMSDARMRGTAYGTIVLHISPESVSGCTTLASKPMVVACQAADAATTIEGLDRGAREVNPIVAAIIGAGGIAAFIAIKAGVTLMILHYHAEISTGVLAAADVVTCG